MKLLGLILVVLGIITFAFQGIRYTTHDLGLFEAKSCTGDMWRLQSPGNKSRDHHLAFKTESISRRLPHHIETADTRPTPLKPRTHRIEKVPNVLA